MQAPGGKLQRLATKRWFGYPGAMASTRKRTWTSKGREKTAWVVDYKDATGKRRLKTFATKKVADAWSVQAQHQVGVGTHTPDSTSITLKAAGDAWIRRCEVERLEASTLRQYRCHLEQHIGPALGPTRVSKLTGPTVARFVDDMLHRHSRAMTRKVLTSLRAILSCALRQGLVAQNVATAVRLTSQGRHTEKVEIPSPDEIRALLAGASPRWRTFLLTAIFSGLRASELRGLRWVDLNLADGRLVVAQRADETGQIGSPKSASSRRSLPLPPILKNALQAWQADCPKGKADLVFPNGVGKPESLANIKNRFFGPLQLQCGLTEMRPGRSGVLTPRRRYGLHVTRHFYASWLIEQGFTPKRVQELMGHSTIKLTLDTYGHLWPDHAADTARLAAAETALLSPAVKLVATSTRQDALSG